MCRDVHLSSTLYFVMDKSFRVSAVISRCLVALTRMQASSTFGGWKVLPVTGMAGSNIAACLPFAVPSRSHEISCSSHKIEGGDGCGGEHSYAAEQGKSGVLDFKSASSTRWKFVTPHLVSRLLKRLKRPRPCKFRGTIRHHVGPLIQGESSQNPSSS